jgi:oligoendopeptidase F
VTPFTRFNNDLKNRKDYAAVIEQWRGQVRDTTLARRLDLHHRDFLQARADPALVIAFADAQAAVQDTVNAFHYQVGGQAKTLTELGEILSTQPDRAKRREAFLAYRQSADKNTAPIVHCMELNDRIGRQEGFANGAEAGLATCSLKRDQVLADLDAFERSTRPAYLKMLAQAKRDLKVERLEAWDIDHWLHVQETAGGSDAWPREPGLERMKGLMKAIGFMPDSLPIDARVWDVPTGGITFPIRPPFESRLLTNPFTGSDFYETLFHEYGHCLNAVLEDKNLPPSFLAGDETPMSEGLAECLGHFAYDRHWLARVAGVTPERAAQLERVGKMQLLLWLRRSICLNAYFELTAYGNLHVDLDSLYAATYLRYAGTPLPPGHMFARRDEFATGPMYLQSYLYANMIATQLRDAMRAQFGVEDLTNEPRVAAWMTAYLYAPGGAVPWPEKVRRATGKPLGTEALSRYLTF